ncbi:M20/M25/M40 family metallo-hydrolase [Paradevosia shaoguanensis]|uniref:M20/M25/M40 family metallo-hydrolase n=1 Tax=Paradevosia shaoguanensis TaxID=1335043 RepID=A0AA41QJ71_9HYPH|nr:M20/M25/M40 family metallo-hydrolase [Paradevosia shaoguanensis]MCF1741027.1 M20/M25/M40 family metallo-hydrolase [Paradevosia shaoguanensis]MCI0125510.1 M20/M25/M40 family metallo-hydrolase [Paradevosia shaoguanensis]
MTRLDDILAYADAQLDQSLGRLFELIRIPSVSTEPEYAGDCQRAAEWLAVQLAEIGMDASVRPTQGHPMVVGHGPAVPGPHVLFYGHYDVQPVDPLNLWNTPPFEPSLAPQPDGETYILGRGASDDKGQLLTFIEACRAWKAVTGSLPIRVSMLFEGEEEAGSPSLGPFLEANAEDLKADTILVCDTDMWDRETPAITTMWRGFVSEEFEVTTADRDLHSGMFGSAARNAVQLIGTIIGKLRNDDGSVAIPGFYDGVTELPEANRKEWERLPFDPEKFLGDVGLSIPAGEAGRSVLEQVWARPTAEVHGVWGGYAGDGFKTVIPAKAGAKISFRLVAGQDPERIRKIFRDFVTALIPADCSVTFKSYAAAGAQTMPLDGKLLNKARTALTEEWQRETALAGTGGSIPILGEFKQRLGMDSLLIGFARFDNRIHSPNEKYDLSSFHRGIRSWVRILHAFSE